MAFVSRLASIVRAMAYWPGAYWVVSLMLAALVTLGSFTARKGMPRGQQLTLDYWYNLAAATELSRHPWGAKDPYVPSDGKSPRFTPQLLAVGVAARALNVRVGDVLDASAGVTVALLCVSVFLLCRKLLGGSPPPILCLLVMLLAWNRPAYESGAYSLPDLLLMASYPYSFAFGLCLLELWLALTYLESGRACHLPVLTGLQSLVFLCHPIVGVWCAMSVAILAVVGIGCGPRRRMLLSISAIAGTLVSFAWPYYSVYQAAVGGSSYFSGYDLYMKALVWSPTAVAGVFGLIGMTEKRGGRFLLAGFVVTFGIFLAGGLFRIECGRRFLFFVFVFLHLGLARLLWGLVSEGHFPDLLLRPRVLAGNPLAAAAAGLVFVVAAVSIATAARFVYELARCNNTFLSAIHKSRLDPDVGRSLRFLERHVGENDVVLSDLRTSWAIPCIRGRTVSYQRREFFFSAVGGKPSKDVTVFFEGSTPESERRAILERYSVRFVLLDVESTSAKVVADILRLGPVVYQSPTWILMHITAEKTGDAPAPTHRAWPRIAASLAAHGLNHVPLGAERPF